MSTTCSWTPSPTGTGSKVMSTSTPRRRRSGPPRASELQAHVLGDDGLHDLVGPAVDAVDAVIRVEPGDGVLVDEAVPAVELQATVDHLAGNLRAEELRGGRLGGGQLTRVKRLQGTV